MMGQFMRKLFRSWPQLSDSLEMEEQRLSQPGWSSKEINVFLVDDINENLTFQSQTIWYKWRRWRIKSFRRYLIVCQRGDWGKMQHQIVESTALNIQYSAQLKITHKVVRRALASVQLWLWLDWSWIRDPTLGSVVSGGWLVTILHYKDSRIIATYISPTAQRYFSLPMRAADKNEKRNVTLLQMFR